MTKAEYMAFHEAYCKTMVSVTKKKNADYTGIGDDPFANFRTAGEIISFNGVSKDQVIRAGFLLRISDKMSRLKSFIAKGMFEVTDESFIDTCLDASNYFALLAGYHAGHLQEQGEDNVGKTDQNTPA